MLRSIQLTNFKGFGAPTTVPLAPITLIFGQNSAGKSSILQALNLLKQTRESRDVEALLLPRTESGFVDLGSFKELLFDHELERTLSLRLDTVPTTRLPRPHFYPRGGVGLEVCFSRRSLKDEISLERVKVFGGPHFEFLAEFEQTHLSGDVRRMAMMPYRPERRSSTAGLRAARCVTITDSPAIWQAAYDWSCEERDQLREVFSKARASLQEQHARPFPGSEETDVTEARRRVIARFEDAVNFFGSPFTLDQYVAWMRQDQLGKIITLDGFIPVGRADEGWWVENFVMNSLDRPLGSRGWTLEVGDIALFAGRATEQALSMLFPLGPFRKPPSRWYIFTGTSPHDVGYQGHLLPDLLYRQPDLCENTNEWLEKLDLGYELNVRPLGEQVTDLFEVRLIDKRRSSPVEVGLSDVGFGISQLLPFVVQSLAATEQIITIEQPEVHIHPRLQADLGDLLAAAIKPPRNNQFIIETHSEHLALRIQKLVRTKGLRPEEVSVVYVSRGSKGATVKTLELDEDGDFTEDFPGGFFPERLRELR